MKSVPAKARWLSASARSAARKTGTAVGGILLEDYQASLKQLRQAGYARYAVDHFRPYLLAAVSQFSSRRQSLTERLILMAARRKARRSKSSRTSRRKKKRLISVALLAKESPRVRRPRSLSNLKQLKRPQK
jgi:hypothetical protein